MGFWTTLKEASTPQGRQARYQRYYQQASGGLLPMRGKQDFYNLELVVVNWGNGTVAVHLHGHMRGFKHTKRIDRVTLNLVSGMTEQEAVRVAAFLSPNHWTIPAFSHLSKYRKHWNTALDARLQAALTDPRYISTSTH